MKETIFRAIQYWALPEKLALSDPMVFLTGPRQVGKTFWAKQQSLRYFNWDTAEVSA